MTRLVLMLGILMLLTRFTQIYWKEQTEKKTEIERKSHNAIANCEFGTLVRYAISPAA